MSHTTKPLVIGSGFLGSHIVREYESAGIKTICTNLTNKKKSISLDITKLQDVENLIEKLQPNLIINCAANTNVDYLEKNPELAFLVNYEGVKNVAKVAHKMGIRLVQVSSDSVFDGTKGLYKEGDATNPINIYAKSKLKGEEVVQQTCANYVIIRTNFYGIDPDSRFLFSKILYELTNKKTIIGFDDVIFTPLEITNLCKMIRELTVTDFNGIIHLASDEILTKYQFCKKIAKVFGFDQDLIKKGSIDDTNFIAKRPKNTSLSNSLSKRFIKSSIMKYETWLYRVANIIDKSKY